MNKSTSVAFELQPVSLGMLKVRRSSLALYLCDLAEASQFSNLVPFGCYCELSWPIDPPRVSALTILIGSVGRQRVYRFLWLRYSLSRFKLWDTQHSRMLEISEVSPLELEDSEPEYSLVPECLESCWAHLWDFWILKFPGLSVITNRERTSAVDCLASVPRSMVAQ